MINVKNRISGIKRLILAAACIMLVMPAGISYAESLRNVMVMAIGKDFVIVEGKMYFATESTEVLNSHNVKVPFLMLQPMSTVNLSFYTNARKKVIIRTIKIVKDQPT